MNCNHKIILFVFISEVFGLTHESQFTHWRYGDGNFSNSLPENVHLYSNGLLSNQPLYEYNTSTQNTNDTLFFYPLITEENDIYVLKKNFTIDWSNHTKCNGVRPCGSYSLYLLKINQYLNETLSELFLQHDLMSDVGCDGLCDYGTTYLYPIYHRYNNDKYVIINIIANITEGEYPQSGISILWIINVTTDNIGIISKTTNHRGIYDWNVIRLQPIVHDKYLLYAVPNVNNTYNNVIFDYNLINLYNGQILWTLQQSVPCQYQKCFKCGWTIINPVAVNNYLIICDHIDANTINTNPSDRLHSINITTGVVLNTIYQSRGLCVLYQPVIYHYYNLIFIPCGCNRYYSENILMLNAINITDNNVIYKYNISIEPGVPSPFMSSQVILSINEKNESNHQLLVNCFSFWYSGYYPDSYYNFSFHLYNILYNMSFELAQMERYLKVHDIVSDSPTYYFMDSRSNSLFGMTSDVHDYYYHQSVYPILSSELKLENHQTWKTNSISEQKIVAYCGIPLTHYPVIGENNLTYITWRNGIFAHENGSYHPKHEYLKWYLIGGCSAFILILLVVLISLLCIYKRKKCSTRTTKLIQK